MDKFRMITDRQVIRSSDDTATSNNFSERTVVYSCNVKLPADVWKFDYWSALLADGTEVTAWVLYFRLLNPAVFKVVIGWKWI